MLEELAVSDGQVPATFEEALAHFWGTTFDEYRSLHDQFFEGGWNAGRASMDAENARLKAALDACVERLMFTDHGGGNTDCDECVDTDAALAQAKAALSGHEVTDEPAAGRAATAG